MRRRFELRVPMTMSPLVRSRRAMRLSAGTVKNPDLASQKNRSRPAIRCGSSTGLEPVATVTVQRVASSAAICSPELAAPTTSTRAPSGSWSGLRYLALCSCGTSGSSCSAMSGMYGAWNGPVATTTWVACSLPAGVVTANGVVLLVQSLYRGVQPHRQLEAGGVAGQVVRDVVLAGVGVGGCREGQAGQRVVLCRAEQAQRVPALPPGVSDLGCGVEQQEACVRIGEVVAEGEAGLTGADDDDVDGSRSAGMVWDIGFS